MFVGERPSGSCAQMHVFNTQKAVFGARGTAQTVIVCILEAQAWRVSQLKNKLAIRLVFIRLEHDQSGHTTENHKPAGR